MGRTGGSAGPDRTVTVVSLALVPPAGLVPRCSGAPEVAVGCSAHAWGGGVEGWRRPMSPLDFALAAFLLISTILYQRLSVQGQAVALVGMYVGLAIASKFYLTLGAMFAEKFPRSSPDLLQMGAFLGLVTAVMAPAILLHLLIRPGRLRMVLIGGLRRYNAGADLVVTDPVDPREEGIVTPVLRLVLALGLSVATAAIVLMVIVALSRSPYAEQADWLVTLRRLIDTSFLGPGLLRAVPVLATSVRLWIPAQQAPIFNI
jgi:hypothetical protein